MLSSPSRMVFSSTIGKSSDTSFPLSVQLRFSSVMSGPEKPSAVTLACSSGSLPPNSVRERISYDRFRELMEGQGAFVYAGWCGSAACEAQVKEETKATIRVLPDEEFRSAEAPTHCLKCGASTTTEALWARAY